MNMTLSSLPTVRMTLVAGCNNCSDTRSVERLSVSTGMWSTLPSLNSERNRHTMVLYTA
jgi:hypothetical protein